MNRSFEGTQEPIVQPNNDNNMIFNDMITGKNILIVVLTGLLILSFLGINLLIILGDWVKALASIVVPFLQQILSLFGYTAGTVLDKTEDITTDVAKTGIDIAGGAVQSVADILKNLGKNGMNDNSMSKFDLTLEKPNSATAPASSSSSPDYRKNEPKADSSETPIQKPITSDKSQWCLVGEYEGKRGCVEVSDASKCLSGQIFPSEQKCMNPSNAPFMFSHAE